MTHDPMPSRFHPIAAGVTLTLTAAACLAIAWLATADPASRWGVCYAAGVVWALSLASLPIVSAGFRKGPQAAASAFLAASGGRMILAMVAALVGALVLALPARPTLFMIVAVYLPLLAVEVIFVYRAAAPPATPRASTEPTA